MVTGKDEIFQILFFSPDKKAAWLLLNPCGQNQAISLRLFS
jgi:hypothetical protein